MGLCIYRYTTYLGVTLSKRLGTTTWIRMSKALFQMMKQSKWHEMSRIMLSGCFVICFSVGVC